MHLLRRGRNRRAQLLRIVATTTASPPLLNPGRAVGRRRLLFEPDAKSTPYGPSFVEVRACLVPPRRSFGRAPSGRVGVLRRRVPLGSSSSSFPPPAYDTSHDAAVILWMPRKLPASHYEAIGVERSQTQSYSAMPRQPRYLGHEFPQRHLSYELLTRGEWRTIGKNPRNL